MEIAEIDVHDDAQVEAFWSTAKAADEFERPYAAYWSLQAATASLRGDSSVMERHPFAAFDDGEIVGTGQLMLPLLDNKHLVMLTPMVKPSHRRRGLGTALLENGLEYARSRGRNTVIIEVNRPMTDSGPGATPGHALLAKHGFSDASVELHRVLDLPVAESRLDALEAEAAERRDGYRLVGIAGSVPDALMADYCHLQEAFNSEAPMGELDLEPEVWDEARVRDMEAMFHRGGRRERSMVALAPDGEMVALTAMMMTDHQPEVGWQSGTLVLKEHRGHRLGLAIKVANLRAYQAEFPLVRVVHSWNAEVNASMVAINDKLGFRPVEYLVEMQRRL